MQTDTLSTSVVGEDAAAPPPVTLAAGPPVRPKGRHTAFHRSSYSALPGSPVTANTAPDDLEFHKASRAYALFFYYLCFVASRTKHGDDIVPLSVPEIASMAQHSRRWVYKALHYLSHHGFVFLIPTPDCVVRTVIDIRLPSASRRSPFSAASGARHTAR